LTLGGASTPADSSAIRSGDVPAVGDPAPEQDSAGVALVIKHEP
jgi:hypothetical protein